MKNALALDVLATLLVINNVHARLPSKIWQINNEPSRDDTAQITLQTRATDNNSEKNDESREVPSNDWMTVTSDGNPNNFFHEDYLYSFHPISKGEKEWQIQRIPKSNRRLQSAEEELEESINDGDGAGSEGENGENGEHGKKTEREYIAMITNILLSLSCITLAAFAAGLTMGMLSLDPLSLEIKRRASPSEEERRWSAALLPLLVGHSKRHRLLVSLLLLNAVANEALPLFLDELFASKYACILASVTLVLFFGEIVPSAFFTGPDQVKVAAKMVPLVKAVMFVLTPVAMPIAALLDKVLHDDDDDGSGNYYNRTELSALVRIQYESQLADKRRRKREQKMLLTKTGTEAKGGEIGGVGRSSVRAASSPDLERANSNGSVSSSIRNPDFSHRSIQSISRDLTDVNRSVDDPEEFTPRRMTSIHRDEITMIEGALSMNTKVAADIYTPLRRVYALPSDTILDEDRMVEIWKRGFSRVPVYAPNAPSCDAPSDFVDTSGVVGVLMVRQLIVVNGTENRPVHTLPLAVPSCIPPSMNLVDLINLFQAGGGRGKGGVHLALVCATPRLAAEALMRRESIPKDAGVFGIITLEDVVEELLQEEIYDEADRDLPLARKGLSKWKKFVSRKKSRRLQQEQEGGATTEATPLLE